MFVSLGSIPYWFFLISAFFFALSPKYLEKKLSNIFFGLYCGLLIIFIGSRFEIGADWNAYDGIYQSIGSLPFLSAILYTDPLYALINLISSHFSLGVFFVNLVCATFFMHGIFKFCIERESKWLSISIFLPYMIFVVGMGYTRQSLALGFFLLSINSICKKQQYHFLFYIILAALSHRTAAPFILLYPLSHEKKSRLSFIFILLLTIPAFISIFYDVFVHKFELYIVNQMDSKGAIQRLALNLVPISILIFNFNRLKSLFLKEEAIIKLFSIATFFMLPMLLISSTLVDRYLLYFLVIQVYVYNIFVFRLLNKFSHLALFIILSFNLLYFYVWSSFSSFSHFWIPYYSYLFYWF